MRLFGGRVLIFEGDEEPAGGTFKPELYEVHHPLPLAWRHRNQVNPLLEYKLARAYRRVVTLCLGLIAFCMMVWWLTANHTVRATLEGAQICAVAIGLFTFGYFMYHRKDYLAWMQLVSELPNLLPGRKTPEEIAKMSMDALKEASSEGVVNLWVTYMEASTNPTSGYGAKAEQLSNLMRRAGIFGPDESNEMLLTRAGEIHEAKKQAQRPQVVHNNAAAGGGH